VEHAQKCKLPICSSEILIPAALRGRGDFGLFARCPALASRSCAALLGSRYRAGLFRKTQEEFAIDGKCDTVRIQMLCGPEAEATGNQGVIENNKSLDFLNLDESCRVSIALGLHGSHRMSEMVRGRTFLRTSLTMIDVL
jgi:hypothetical protein